MVTGTRGAKWIQLGDLRSGKGEPIYAAIRVIDNGGMLNVNTAYEFDSTGSSDEIDGSSQMQINLLALGHHFPDLPDSNDEDDLKIMRAGDEDEDDLDDYAERVVWRYDVPDGNYTPFDIGDELELRNRYIINQDEIEARVEEWGGEFRRYTSSTPMDDLDEWGKTVYYGAALDPNYAYRHIATVYNMDGIIKPNGYMMVPVNDTNESILNMWVREALLVANPNFVDVNTVSAQIAVNIADSVDSDSNVSVLNVGGTDYYGFEQPCVYISEIAFAFDPCDPNMPGDPNHRSYAIELYKPYGDTYYNDFTLKIDNNSVGLSDIDINIDDWSGTGQYHDVPIYAKLRWVDTGGPYDIYYGIDINDANSGATAKVSGHSDSDYDPPNWNNDTTYYWRIDDTSIVGEGDIWEFTTHASDPEPNEQNDLVDEDKLFDENSIIKLTRDVNGFDLLVDSIDIPNWLVDESNGVNVKRSYQRDISRHKCIRGLWGSGTDPNLGHINKYVDADTATIQAHPANAGFVNIGQIGRVFRRSAYQGSVGTGDSEADVLIDLADPNYQKLLQYLTVFDPTNDNIDNDGDGTDDNWQEIKVAGRININTAPWFVISQLPWVSDELAQAIVAYRDMTKIAANAVDYSDRYAETNIDGVRETVGFASIGELMNVINTENEDDYSIRYYVLGTEQNDDLDDYPDLSYSDGAADDFEERDVIFARISNLASVRSDVYTAYILVRIGTDGPQKRIIAILDRSGVYTGGGDVKVRAYHPVPDAR